MSSVSSCEFSSKSDFQSALLSSPLKGIALFLKILRDWFSVLLTYPLRPVVISEIKKVLRCKDPNNGVMYACDRCNKLRFVPFTCKSRFCPSCGNLYNMQRANALAERMIDVRHRHVIFTIPASLRVYFLNDRSLLNVLFEASAETYKTVIGNTFKGNLLPGIICVLHTFSRSSDWNPHVHCLATEGGLTDWGKWYARPFINFDALRTTYQDILLKKLRHRIPDFQPIEAALRSDYPQGFVVHAALPPENLQGDNKLKQLVRYVARYLGRPCIGTSRIDSYDGKSVTFHYMAHVGKKEEYRTETLPAIDFLLRLSQHIQEPHFVMVRYFGIYSTFGLSSDAMLKGLRMGNFHMLYDPARHAFRFRQCHWRGAMERIFHVDPLICPCCHEEMIPIYYVFEGKTVFDPPIKGQGVKLGRKKCNFGYIDD